MSNNVEASRIFDVDQDSKSLRELKSYQFVSTQQLVGTPIEEMDYYTGDGLYQRGEINNRPRFNAVRNMKKLPAFDGSSQTVDFLDWIDTLQDYFVAMNPPNALICKLAASKLTGEAHEWWKELQIHRVSEGKSLITSWPRMNDLLHERFLNTSRLTWWYKQENEDNEKHNNCLMKGPSETVNSPVENKQTVEEALSTSDEKERFASNESFTTEHLEENVMVKDRFMPITCSTKVPLESDIDKSDEENELGSVGVFKPNLEDTGNTDNSKESKSWKPTVEFRSLGVSGLIVDSSSRTMEGTMGHNQQKGKLFGHEPLNLVDEYAKKSKTEQVQYKDTDSSLVGELIDAPIMCLSNLIRHQLEGFMKVERSTNNMHTNVLQDEFGLNLVGLKHDPVFMCDVQPYVGATTNVNLQDGNLSFIYDPGGCWEIDKLKDQKLVKQFASQIRTRIGNNLGSKVDMVEREQNRRHTLFSSNDVDIIVDEILTLSFDPGGVTKRGNMFSPVISKVESAEISLPEVQIQGMIFRHIMEAISNISSSISHKNLIDGEYMAYTNAIVKLATLLFDPGGNFCSIITPSTSWRHDLLAFSVIVMRRSHDWGERQGSVLHQVTSSPQNSSIDFRNVKQRQVALAFNKAIKVCDCEVCRQRLFCVEKCHCAPCQLGLNRFPVLTPSTSVSEIVDRVDAESTWGVVRMADESLYMTNIPMLEVPVDRQKPSNTFVSLMLKACQTLGRDTMDSGKKMDVTKLESFLFDPGGIPISQYFGTDLASNRTVLFWNVIENAFAMQRNAHLEDGVEVPISIIREGYISVSSVSKGPEGVNLRVTCSPVVLKEYLMYTNSNWEIPHGPAEYLTFATAHCFQLNESEDQPSLLLKCSLTKVRLANMNVLFDPGGNLYFSGTSHLNECPLHGSNISLMITATHIVLCKNALLVVIGETKQGSASWTNLLDVFMTALRSDQLAKGILVGAEIKQREEIWSNDMSIQVQMDIMRKFWKPMLEMMLKFVIKLALMYGIECSALSYAQESEWSCGIEYIYDRIKVLFDNLTMVSLLCIYEANHLGLTLPCSISFVSYETTSGILLGDVIHLKAEGTKEGIVVVYITFDPGGHLNMLALKDQLLFLFHSRENYICLSDGDRGYHCFITRGRVIPREAWNDGNETSMFRMAMLIVDTICTCLMVLDKKGQLMRTPKLFRSVVNGLDPPTDLVVILEVSMCCTNLYQWMRSWTSFFF